MAGIIQKIGETLHVGGHKEEDKHKGVHHGEEHKSHGEHYKPDHHGEAHGQGEHKEGLVEKIKYKIHGGEGHGSKEGEKKKKKKKKKEKKKHEDGHHHDSSSSDSD